MQREFQDLVVTSGYQQESRPLYEWVAMQASAWATHKNVGLVVGATYPDELRRVRELCPEMPILIPGVGKQQGALEMAVRYGIDTQGRNAVINASRSVLYASRDQRDFQDAARKEASRLRERINADLQQLERGWGGE